jgi:hypothetical protein
MSKLYTPKELAALLPWYVAGSLPAEEQRAVEDWLRGDPVAGEQARALQQIRAAAAGQPLATPSPIVRQQLSARLKALRHPHSPRLSWSWAAGAVLAIIVLVGLWSLVQPGIALQWSVSGDGAIVYRIYRAVDNNHDFELLSEVAAQPEAQAYTFTDTRALPGQTYTYLIEAVTQTGLPVLSSTVTSNGLAAFPAQLALLCSSLAVGGLAVYLMRSWSDLVKGRRLLGA